MLRLSDFVTCRKRYYSQSGGMYMSKLIPVNSHRNPAFRLQLTATSPASDTITQSPFPLTVTSALLPSTRYTLNQPLTTF